MTRALRAFLLFGLMGCLAVLAASSIQAQAPQAPTAQAPAAQAPAAAAPAGQAPAAQQPQAPPPVNQSDDPVLKTFRWRNIGPASMGGRIDDFAVVENNPSTYYVGFATGGIFKTVNNGTTFAPIFDTYPTSSIGDIAIAPSDPEHHLRRHRRAEQPAEFVVRRRHLQVDRRRQDVHQRRPQGDAVDRARRRAPDQAGHRLRGGHRPPLRAEQGARALQDDRRRQDLDEHQVHRRGHRLHRRGDGPGEARHSCIAASYQRRRTPHGFNGGGPGSALWKTTDGGKTWTKLTGSGPAGAARSSAASGSTSAGRSRTSSYAQIEVGASGGTGAGVTADGKEQAPAPAAAAARARRRRRRAAGRQARAAVRGRRAAAVSRPARVRRGGPGGQAAVGAGAAASRRRRQPARSGEAQRHLAVG